MEKFKNLRFVEQSPKILGLKLKTAVFCILFLLVSLIMLTKSLFFSLILMLFPYAFIKIDSKFKSEGHFQDYIATLLKAKKKYVFDVNMAEIVTPKNKKDE